MGVGWSGDYAVVEVEVFVGWGEFGVVGCYGWGDYVCDVCVMFFWEKMKKEVRGGEAAFGGMKRRARRFEPSGPELLLGQSDQK